MDARKEALSDTDEPSLESRVADNLMVVPWSNVVVVVGGVIGE